MNHLAGLREASAASGSVAAEWQGEVVHLHLSLRRAGSARQLRHEAGCARQHSRRIQADRHATRRAFRSASTCRCWPSAATCGRWCRSLTHPSNDHSAGHHIMLTGRTRPAAGLRPEQAAAERLAVDRGRRRRRRPCARNNLPPAVVLPGTAGSLLAAASFPVSSRGQMGPRRDPWFIEASPYQLHGVRRVSRIRVRSPGAREHAATSRRSRRRA